MPIQQTSLYSLFVSKYPGTGETREGVEGEHWWPLVCALRDYLSRSNQITGLIVSPGFLSEGPYKAIDFFRSLQELLTFSEQRNRRLDIAVTKGVTEVTD